MSTFFSALPFLLQLSRYSGDPTTNASYGVSSGYNNRNYHHLPTQDHSTSNNLTASYAGSHGIASSQSQGVPWRSFRNGHRVPRSGSESVGTSLGPLTITLPSNQGGDTSRLYSSYVNSEEPRDSSTKASDPSHLPEMSSPITDYQSVSWVRGVPAADCDLLYHANVDPMLSTQ